MINEKQLAITLAWLNARLHFNILFILRILIFINVDRLYLRSRPLSQARKRYNPLSLFLYLVLISSNSKSLYFLTLVFSASCSSCNTRSLPILAIKPTR